MGKIYCSECGTQLDDSVKFCSNCGTPLSDEYTPLNRNKGINIDSFTTNDIMSNIEILPIAVGCILTFVFFILGSSGLLGGSMYISMMFPEGVAYSLLFGSFFAGLLYKKSILFALIHGLLIAIIMEFFFIFTTYIAVGHDEFYFLCIIAGLLGAFIGNFIITKIKKD